MQIRFNLNILNIFKIGRLILLTSAVLWIKIPISNYTFPQYAFPSIWLRCYFDCSTNTLINYISLKELNWRWTGFCFCCTFHSHFFSLESTAVLPHRWTIWSRHYSKAMTRGPDLSLIRTKPSKYTSVFIFPLSTTSMR